MSGWEDDAKRKAESARRLWLEMMSQKIRSAFHQISEIDVEHSNFGTPSRVRVIHQDLDEIIDLLLKNGVDKSDIPSKRTLDPEDDLSLSYQQIKSDILKIADWFGVDVLSKNSSTTKSPQINVQVIQSNVQDVKNVAEVINTIKISDIKKDEIKKLFSELETIAKNKGMDDSTKNSKLRELFKGIVDLSLDAGIVGLRWAHENGIIDRLFGNH